MNYKQGFTLIELLLVIGVVTLLSSVLFYNTSEAKKRAEDAHMQAESEQVKTAVTLYRNDTGKYPLTSRYVSSNARPGVVHSESDPESDYLATMQELVDGGYLSEIPRSPDGQSYAYGVSEDGENAMFVATLKKSGPRNSSNNSCEFVYVQSDDPEPPIPWIPCYTRPGTCTTTTSFVAPQCTETEDSSFCTEPETINLTVCTPSERICPSGSEYTIGTPPRLPVEVTCGGAYESDYCQCI